MGMAVLWLERRTGALNHIYINNAAEAGQIYQLYAGKSFLKEERWKSSR